MNELQYILMRSGADDMIGVFSILSLVAALVVYFVFLSPKNNKKFTGFIGFCYEFFSFRKLALEAVLKVTYLFFACLITISSIAGMFHNFFGALTIFITSNIMIRITYETLLIFIIMCKNTTEINCKLSGGDKSVKNQFITDVELPEGMMEQVANKVSSAANSMAPKAEFCKSCGAAIKEDDVFCPSCGNKLK